MILLDLQAMDATPVDAPQDNWDGGGHGGGGSELSVLLCDSVASVLLCL